MGVRISRREKKWKLERTIETFRSMKILLSLFVSCWCFDKRVNNSAAVKKSTNFIWMWEFFHPSQHTWNSWRVLIADMNEATERMIHLNFKCWGRFEMIEKIPLGLENYLNFPLARFLFDTLGCSDPNRQPVRLIITPYYANHVGFMCLVIIGSFSYMSWVWRESTLSIRRSTHEEQLWTFSVFSD